VRNFERTLPREVFVLISLKEITAQNFNECMSLERKSQKYVGDAAYILAEAYIYRYNSTAYGIYLDDKMIGLVILKDRPAGSPYSFTDLFIADPYQNKGYGSAAVKLIIDKFQNEKSAPDIEIQVHNTNQYAIRIYENNKFKVTGKAQWDSNSLVMRLNINEQEP